MIYHDKPVIDLPKVRIERCADGDYMYWFIDTMDDEPIDVISINRYDADAKYASSCVKSQSDFNKILAATVSAYYAGDNK